MDTKVTLPRLYSDLATWWPLLSAPEDYAEEAEFYRRLLVGASGLPVKSVLELGSGGGNNASHLKAHFKMTLVDLSPGMLQVSRALNPECEHLQGDMRTLRLNRLFDAVFIHDAVMYMTTRDDLRRAIDTAFVHCKPGGAALFVPDYCREIFRPGTEHGGRDGADRALRYLSWTYDPDPDDTTFLTDFVYLLREGKQTTTVEHEQHVQGLFPRAEWLDLLLRVGFNPSIVPDSYARELFVARKET